MYRVLIFQKYNFDWKWILPREPQTLYLLERTMECPHHIMCTNICNVSKTVHFVLRTLFFGSQFLICITSWRVWMEVWECVLWCFYRRKVGFGGFSHLKYFGLFTYNRIQSKPIKPNRIKSNWKNKLYLIRVSKRVSRKSKKRKPFQEREVETGLDVRIRIQFPHSRHHPYRGWCYL